MSRKTIGILFAAYFLAALIFGLLIEWGFDRHHPFSVFAADVINLALWPYIMSGLIPMIFWAFRRFRAERAALPFIAWAFLGVMLMGVATLGAFYMPGDEQINRAATNIASLSGVGYDAFQRGFTKRCVDKQRSSQLNQKTEITERQIAIYCQCVAETVAKGITAEDLGFLVRNWYPSDSVREKADNAAPACLHLALGR
jgi:hypothetical protein